MARERLLTLLLAVVCIVSGAFVGESYIGRLPDYRGFWLVRVEDHVRAPKPTRPRRTVVIVADGLRRESAETMASTRRIAQRGQCRISDQGSYTVSRPVYALLSTGIEVDRTGARNNDLTAPLPIDSVWDVARREGLTVRGSSHLPWFKQLFPAGFDSFRHSVSHDTNVFAPSSPASADSFDVDLYHPLYIDEAGHQNGGSSAEYAAAVARADVEIAAVLDTLDFSRDLVILTGDHGHRDEGGHGGSQPEIRHVLACFAGPNIEPRTDRLPFDGRVTGPLLSVLLGIPFPAQMRAGDDGLDAIWEIARFDPADDAYVKDRRDAVTEYRRQNAAALETWLGRPATWSQLYDRERNKQVLRTAGVMLVALLVLALRLRRDPERARYGLWLAGVLVLLWAAHHAVLGDFDYTVINRKARFVPLAFGIVALAAVGAVGLYYALHRRLASITTRFATLLLLLLLMSGGHIVVYGWPLGFPLPPDPARYWPFFGAIAQVGFALATAALLLVDRQPVSPRVEPRAISPLSTGSRTAR